MPPALTSCLDLNQLRPLSKVQPIFVQYVGDLCKNTFQAKALKACLEPPNIIPDNNGPLLGIGCGTQDAPEPGFVLVAPFNRLSNLLIYIF